MITSTGKQIIGKYLLGLTPAYASYIAIGCGARPGETGGEQLKLLGDVWSEYWLVPGFIEDPDELISIGDGGFNPKRIYVLNNTTTPLSQDLVGQVVKIKSLSADPDSPFFNNGRLSQTQETKIVSIDNESTRLQDAGLYLEYDSLISIVIDTVPEEYLYDTEVEVTAGFDKKVLDFETLRVPITSRGYVTDNGVSKIVFTGELPSEERYEISEVGIFSAGENDEAGIYDSKTILSFSDQEDWQLNAGPLTASAGGSVYYPSVTEKITDSNGVLTTAVDSAYAVKTNASNPTFFETARAERFERCRYLNNIYMLQGNSSHIRNVTKKTGTISGTSASTTITGIDSTTGLTTGMKLIKISGTGAFGGVATITGVSSTSINITSESANTAGSITFQSSITDLHIIEDSTSNDDFTTKYLQLNDQNVNFAKNSTSDLLKVAFSVVGRDAGTKNPDSVKLILQFTNLDGSQYAQLEAEALIQDYSFNTNRYIVIEKRLDELTYSPTFSWGNVNIVKVYASASRELDITDVELASNYATITTDDSVFAGDIVTITNLPAPYNATFNGTYVVDAVSGNDFSFNKTATNVTAASPSGGKVEVSTKDFWIALDAVRFDNISTLNPLYGMIGYSTISGTETITKSANTSNYIEFRFALDVL